MSYYDYEMSLKISAEDPPFYALIMACFRKADTDNLETLRHAFPAAWAEYDERYNSPGGLSKDELLEKVVSELPKTILGRKVVVTEASSTKFNIILGDWSCWVPPPQAAEEEPEPDHPLSKYFGPEDGYWEEPDETPSD